MEFAHFSIVFIINKGLGVHCTPSQTDVDKQKVEDYESQMQQPLSLYCCKSCGQGYKWCNKYRLAVDE
jgi:hypothetical protein